MPADARQVLDMQAHSLPLGGGFNQGGGSSSVSARRTSVCEAATRVPNVRTDARAPPPRRRSRQARTSHRLAEP